MDAAAFEKLGFEHAGAWSLDQKLKSGVRFTLTRLEDERVIYAFAVDGKVMYVGVCDSTSTHLADRMRRYQGMMGAGTNERIARRIRKALRQGLTVTILGWLPAHDCTVGGVRVDLVKGLENPLIKLADPPWNILLRASA